jgi:peptidoglycan/LPS O-acetylase OafA/YrhL
LVVFVWLKNGRGVLGIAAIMLAASMAARVLTLLLHLPHPFMWAATITRLDPLAFGIALAGARAQQLIAHLSQRAALASLGAGVVAFAAAALAGPVERQSYASVTQYSATAIASACLLVGTLRHQGFARLLAAPALRYLGKISYGLYAFHLVVISAVHRLVSMSGVAASLAPLITFLLALSAVVFLSGLSYRYFETPFLHLKERFAIVRSRAV